MLSVRTAFKQVILVHAIRWLVATIWMMLPFAYVSAADNERDLNSSIVWERVADLPADPWHSLVSSNDHASLPCDLPHEICPKLSGILETWGIQVHGHLDQGITTNSRNSRNPPGGIGNFPATQDNYLNDEPMLNELLLEISRPTNTDDRAWDIGGHIDFLYGTNYQFNVSRGLETRGDFSPKWNSGDGRGMGGIGLTGIQLPQLYLDVAYRKLLVSLGHFYHPLGYESQISTANVYYSNSYGSTYSQEGTPVTGAMAQYQLTDNWLARGGFHRGFANWEDNNNYLNVLGELEWASDSGVVLFEYIFDVGKEDDAGRFWQYIHSLELQIQMTERSSYVVYSDLGFQQGAATNGTTAWWYNVSHYLTYDVNACWTVGVRYEWFDDVDGVIVVAPAPNATATGPGVYHGLTLGANYVPEDNVRLRPELRWDWFAADPGTTASPFGDGRERSQFMAAVDLLIEY